MRRTHVQRMLLPACLLLPLGVIASGCTDPVYGPQNPTVPSDIQIAPKPPPAISGGTMIVLHDGRVAVADPDRDRVSIVDLSSMTVAGRVQLADNEEPGRLAEDAAGRIHVALRHGGAVATIDPASMTLTARTAVCPSPRGVAYDAAKDAIHVACESGDLVTLAASTSKELRRLRVSRDMRDVIVDGDRVIVSRFRAADLITIASDGSIEGTTSPLPIFTPADGTQNEYEAAVAWRTLPLKGGGAVMLHQRGLKSTVILAPGGYYSTAGCDGNIVHAALTVIRSPWGKPSTTETTASNAIAAATLPVDAAISDDGTSVALVAAGANLLYVMPFHQIEAEAGSGNCIPSVIPSDVPGQPISVVWAQGNTPIVQTREPSTLWVGGSTIELAPPEDSVADTGHMMFHKPPGFGAIACASCHPEGHDDGRTWHFDPVGARRTQNIGIGGGLMETAPFHWSGDLANMDALMSEVFVSRMGGQNPGPRHTLRFQMWLDQLPALSAAPSVDPAAAARGQALFTDANVGCSSCHMGPHLTNNQSKNVGTGDTFQVPSLVSVSARLPLMHDGCATTLKDRFDPTCGGGDQHGHTSQLSPAQIDDLVAYLETL